MSNDEFQKTVLEQLKLINIKLETIEDNQRILIDQTKELTEFRHAVIESSKEFTKKIS